MLFQADQAFVGVHHLLQVHRARVQEGEGGVGIIALIQGTGRGQIQGAVCVKCGENAPAEVSAHGDEVNLRELGLQASQVPTDFQKVLVLKHFIGADIGRAPAEVGACLRFDAGTGTAGNSRDVDVALEQTFRRERQQGQLDGGGETAGIGHFLRALNPGFLPLRKAIDIAFPLVAVILRQVDHLQAFRLLMAFPEARAFAVGAAEEQDIGLAKVHAVGEMQVRISPEAFMDQGKGFPGMAFRMHERNGHGRMVYQQPQQFTGRISGPANDSYLIHGHPILRGDGWSGARWDRTAGPCRCTFYSRGFAGWGNDGSLHSLSRTPGRR